MVKAKKSIFTWWVSIFHSYFIFGLSDGIFAFLFCALLILFPRCLAAAQMSLLLVFEQDRADSLKELTVDRPQLLRYILMYRTLAHAKITRRFSHGSSVLYNIIAQQLTPPRLTEICHLSLFSVEIRQPIWYNRNEKLIPLLQYAVVDRKRTKGIDLW